MFRVCRLLVTVINNGAWDYESQKIRLIKAYLKSPGCFLFSLCRENKSFCSPVTVAEKQKTRLRRSYDLFSRAHSPKRVSSLAHTSNIRRACQQVFTL